MAIKTTAQLKAAVAFIMSGAAAASIRGDPVRAALDDIIDSRGVVSAVKAGAVITLTLADGTDITITETAASRPSSAQYHATVTATSARPNAAALTVGVDHRDSTDGSITGWAGRTSNGWLWIWSSHELTDIRNGDGNFNQFSSFEAAVRLTVGSVNGYLYRSHTILYPAALNLNWRVS